MKDRWYAGVITGVVGMIIVETLIRLLFFNF